MNTKKLLFAIAMTMVALPLAAQDHQLSAPIKVVGAAQVERKCFTGDSLSAPRLTRADMIRGFNLAWIDEMEPLRVKANSEARQICNEGDYDTVSFTFVRRTGDRNLSISTGSRPVVASTAP